MFNLTFGRFRFLVRGCGARIRRLAIRGGVFGFAVAAVAGVGALGPNRVAYAGEPVVGADPTGEVETVTPGEVEVHAIGPVDRMGQFHPAVVHFPIAWLVGLTLVDLAGLVMKRETWQKVGVYVLAGAVLSLVPTVATGLLRAARMPADPAVQTLLYTHRLLTLVVAGIMLAALGLRLARRNRLENRWRVTYLVLVFAATGLVLVAADFGGRLVYGS